MRVLYVCALYPTHIILYCSVIYSNGYTTDVGTRFSITITPLGPMTEPITRLCLLCVCHETIFLQVTSTMPQAHAPTQTQTHTCDLPRTHVGARRETTWYTAVHVQPVDIVWLAGHVPLTTRMSVWKTIIMTTATIIPSGCIEKMGCTVYV